MNNLTKSQLNCLLNTKAMSNAVHIIERWECLNDVVNEVLENGLMDRDAYWHSILELKNLGLIDSDITDDDIDLIDGMDFQIIGLTSDGEEYIENLNHILLEEKPKSFLKKFDEICGKISDSGTVRLLSSVLLPITGILI